MESSNTKKVGVKMDAKPCTLVICPVCGTLIALDKNNKDIFARCYACSSDFKIGDASKLGYRIETNEWIGVKN